MLIRKNNGEEPADPRSLEGRLARVMDAFRMENITYERLRKTYMNGSADETVLMIMNALSREHLLDAFVSQVRDLYDYILIDCSPSLNLVTINVLTAVDSVIIPVEASYLSMAGLQQLLGSIGSTKWKKYVKTGFMAKLISPALIGFTQSFFQSSHEQLSDSP